MRYASGVTWKRIFFLTLVLQTLNGWSDSLPCIDLLPYFPPSGLRKLSYCEETTINAYRKVGSRSSKWDSNAEPALLIYARFICAEQVVAGTTNFDVMAKGLKAALDAGCDDPLVEYAAVRLSQREINFGPKRRAVTKSSVEIYRNIIEGLKTHPYPGIRQTFMYLRAAETLQQDRADRTQIQDLLITSAEQLAQAIKDRANRDDIYPVAGEIFNTYRSVAGDRKPIFDAFQRQVVKKGILTNEVALVVKAMFYIQWGWDARGAGTMDSVTSEGWRLFIERLATAREMLEFAWKQDPTDAFACSQMMGALAAAGRPRIEWDQWFQLGKKANLACGALYMVKLNYLQPKWGGSEKETIQFARECVKEGNWKELIPFILIDAYDQLDGDQILFNTSYRFSDGWNEIQDVYESYLKQFPGNNGIRSVYCHFAVKAKKWELAKRLLDQMGDLVVPQAFHGGYTYDVQEINRHANLN